MKANHISRDFKPKCTSCDHHHCGICKDCHRCGCRRYRKPGDKALCGMCGNERTGHNGGWVEDGQGVSRPCLECAARKAVKRATVEMPEVRA